VLGVLAREGDGVPLDPAAAYYHFQIAILQGGEPAKHLLGNDVIDLSSKLKAEQTRELTSNANTWFRGRQAALVFVLKDGKNWKQFHACGRTAQDEGVHAGQLLPPPAVATESVSLIQSSQ
jgi:TPR repeat protein